MKQKNLAIFLIVSCTANIVVRAQVAVWDSTIRPEIYRSRVELFNSFPQHRSDVVFLGNSIAFWGEWAELLGNKRVKNRGIPGDTSYGVLERLDQIIRGQPSKIFLMIGINDLARNTPVEVLVRNQEKMVRRMKMGSPRTKIYIQSLLPVNDSFNRLPAHQSKGPQVVATNVELKALAAREKVSFIDLHHHFVDASGSLRKELTFDGIHLTLAGYRLWEKILRDEKFL